MKPSKRVKKEREAKRMRNGIEAAILRARQAGFEVYEVTIGADTYFNLLWLMGEQWAETGELMEVPLVIEDQEDSRAFGMATSAPQGEESVKALQEAMASRGIESTETP